MVDIWGGFLIVFGQHWSFMAWRKKIYQALAEKQYLFGRIGSLLFWSFNERNIEYLLTYLLNDRWYSPFQQSFCLCVYLALFQRLSGPLLPSWLLHSPHCVSLPPCRGPVRRVRGQRCVQRSGDVLPGEGGPERRTRRPVRPERHAAREPRRVGDAVHLWVRGVAVSRRTQSSYRGPFGDVLISTWPSAKEIKTSDPWGVKRRK